MQTDSWSTILCGGVEGKKKYKEQADMSELYKTQNKRWNKGSIPEK